LLINSVKKKKKGLIFYDQNILSLKYEIDYQIFNTNFISS